MSLSNWFQSCYCIDHATLKYLFTKGDSKPRLLRLIFFLQEFDLEFKDKKGVENIVDDHLTRLDNVAVTKKEKNITKDFSDEDLSAISKRPLFSDMDNYKAMKSVPK